MTTTFLVTILALVAVFIVFGVRVVPQQSAWVVERLGRYHGTLTAGLNIIVPFLDRVAYKHSLKEVAWDIDPQVCITRDNASVTVDGVLYFQVMDPKLASYGTANFLTAISQLAKTTLRSEVGKRELDKLLEERTELNAAVVNALDEASLNWGVKVLRYEIMDITPPEEVLRAMMQQLTAERDKRARIAESEGEKQAAINKANGAREATIAESEGDKQAAINKAEGEARALALVAEAQAEAIRKVADALNQNGGEQAANLKIAEQYVTAFGNVAKQGTTLILPGNLADMGSLVAGAMTVMQHSAKKA